MKILVFGTGYVGLVTGVCFAEIGHEVVCIDKDKKKIEKLNKGKTTIHEAGIDKKIKNGIVSGKLTFSSDFKEIKEYDAIFICVGTPDGGKGKPNLKNLNNVVSQICENISSDTHIFVKSTVPVGTCLEMQSKIDEFLFKNDKKIRVTVTSNPEFLSEGNAINDFMKPDRIILGTEDSDAFSLGKEIYKSFHRSNYRIMKMSQNSAEMTKYASNTFLATKISFMNQLSHLCDLKGVDIDSVRAGMSLDPRIGKHFLYAGCGFGGSCFPKDLNSLISQSQEHLYKFSILEEVIKANKIQKTFLVEKVLENLGKKVKDSTIAIWGVSFKPETDDIRESPAVSMTNSLLEAGAKIHLYDPIALNNARDHFLNEEAISYFDDSFKAAAGADAVIVCTEWKEFNNLNYQELLKTMNGNLFLDGRNIYDPLIMSKAGFKYYSVGRNNV